MRSSLLLVAGVIVAATASVSAATPAEPEPMTTTFAVIRNGEPIGTSTFHPQRNGREMIANFATHVQVKIFSITVYRFDQQETERWADGRLVALDAVTDDNGTIHKVTAQNRGNALAVEADGRLSEVDPGVIPASLWNTALTRQRLALNTQDGSLTPVSVVDHGEERLLLHGRPLLAHHYSIKTSFPQDVWYDQQQRLVKVVMQGSDGSQIQYQAG